MTELWSMKGLAGRHERKKRLGRGPGSGLGKTSGKGHKGQRARSGYAANAGFEGGRMPLYRQLPKRGFKNSLFKKEYAWINVEDLNAFEEQQMVDPEVLLQRGKIHALGEGLKVLGRGLLNKKLVVKAHAFSRPAQEKITKAGGQVVVLS